MTNSPSNIEQGGRKRPHPELLASSNRGSNASITENEKIYIGVIFGLVVMIFFIIWIATKGAFVK